MGSKDKLDISPIFILGNPRSGTTLLRLILTCHPRICIPPEGGWLMQLYPKYGNITFNQNTLSAFLDDLFSTPKIEGWGLDRSHLLEQLKAEMPENYATLASTVYLNYASKHGKVRWGDKNNFYLKHIHDLSILFKKAVFLHIVRDGRDVACSYRALSETKGLYAPNLTTSVWGAAYEWTRNLTIIQKGLEALGEARAFTVRYEDLVQQPEETLQSICLFLGEAYDERMLTFYKQNRKNQLEPEAFMSWKSLTKMPITSARMGRWKQEMFEEDLIVFEILAKKLLLKYGYPVSSGVERSSLVSLLLRAYAFFRSLERNSKTWIRKVSKAL